MRRTNIYLTEEQRAGLATRAAAEGTSVAEVVRRLVDRALAGGAGDDLADDLAAIDGSFGALRHDGIDVDRTDGERGAHLERLGHQ